MKYQKNIDLIFFSKENPYFHYAVLFAKDFAKKIDEDWSENRLKALSLSYDLNYELIKMFLSQSDLSKVRQDKFFQLSFGNVFLSMQIEFKCHGMFLFAERVWDRSLVKSAYKLSKSFLEIAKLWLR